MMRRLFRKLFFLLFLLLAFLYFRAVLSEKWAEIEIPVVKILTGEEHEEELSEDEELLLAYQELNPDVVGIIRIPDTVLDHPVVQTPENEEYYLYRDLNGDYNSHGVPFLSADSDWEKAGSNSIIYGHNIRLKSRDVFCDLAYYEDVAYYKEHPYITTVSESGTRQWVIWAYYLVDTSDEDPFRYSDVTGFLAKRDFEEYVENIQIRNWIDVDIPVEYGDTLLTLSSCSVELAGSGTNRMVVVARLVEEGEDFSESIRQAEAAEEPVLPEKLSADP